MHYIACNSRCHVHVEHTYSYFVNIWLICTWHLVCKRNPRSVERSDKVTGRLNTINVDFNPRSGERSDEYIEGLYYGSHISIHAPANGATGIIALLAMLWIKFQSTLRRTERRLRDMMSRLDYYFNPRSGERSDTIYI